MKKSPLPTTPGSWGYLMYEDIPRYDRSLKLMMGAILAGTLIAGIVLLFTNVAGSLTMFGVTLLDALLFYFVAPRRYQIFNTKVRIVLGWPFGMDIPLATIKEAHPASRWDTFGYWGIRLATSSNGAMEIVRTKGWNVVISPSNREAFLERLNQSLKAIQGSQ